MPRKRVHVPPNQTVILKGIKDYAGKSEVEAFLDRIGCTKPSSNPNPVPDKEDKGSKLVYLNFESAAIAARSAEVIRSVKDKPVFCHAQKFAAVLKSESPSSSVKNTVLAQSDSDSDSEDDATFVEYLCNRLAEKGGSMSAGPVGSMAKKNKTWERDVEVAGGLKSYIMDHDNKLEWVTDGGCGLIRLVKSDFKVGDRVRIKPEIDRPALGWGNIRGWSIGIISKVEGKRCSVDFPEQSGWKGHSEDIEIAPPGNPCQLGMGKVDPRFDEFGFIRFEGSKISFTGNDRTSVKERREKGFVLSKEGLSPQNPYFEVRIVADSPKGVGIGVSRKGFSVGMMPGWSQGSIGFHSDDGNLFLEDGTGSNFGPTSSSGDTLGCGLLFSGRAPTTLYFTRNRELIGRVPLTDSSMIYPVVGSSSPAVVEVNLSPAPVAIPKACTLKSQSSQLREFENLVLAVEALSTGDTLLLSDCGKHFIKTPLMISKTCSIDGLNGATSSKAEILSGNGQHVIRCAGPCVTLKSLHIQSFGGDVTKVIQGGAAGVVLLGGGLTIENSKIQCQKGTGLGIITDASKLPHLKLSCLKSIPNQCEMFVVKDCVIGPCGRHGIVMDPCQERIQLESLTISDCGQSGIALNPGTSCIYNILNCKIAKCDHGVLMYRSKAKLSGTLFESCRTYGFFATSKGKYVQESELEATFETCRFVKCSIGAEGLETSLSFSKDCVLPTSGVSAKAGAKINIEGKETKKVFKADTTLERPQSNDSKETLSKDSTKGGDETSDSKFNEKDNFGRYCRLLLEITPAALRIIFKQMFLNTAKKSWTRSCGMDLLSSMDDFNQRKLGKAAVMKMREGNCDDWDMSVLASILLFSPGYLRGQSKASAAVERLRDQRNTLVHVQALKGLAMAPDEFSKEWAAACGSLDELLLSMSPTESESIREMISKALTEKFSDSQVDDFFDQLQAQIKQVADIAEGALLKAENAATKSEVDRRIKIALEDLMMKNGQIDSDRLPQLVELSNKACYNMVRRIGAGGMGTVFAAVDKDDTAVALKICEVTGTDRGDREAHILEKLMKLQHPNIVRFLDSARLNTRLVIVMELVQGESLDSWLDKKAPAVDDERWPVTYEDSKEIMLQLTNGMAAVHNMRIAHRDLKPANVMFDEVTQHVVIVDFGLSKEQNVNQTVTHATSMVGTTMYMSPEQLNGITAEIDLRTDVWSLGAIQFEILTGSTPFAPRRSLSSGDTVTSSSKSGVWRKQVYSKADEGRMTTAILESPVPEIPGAPVPIRDIICRALMKDKKDRFSSASDMHNALLDAYLSLSSDANRTKSSSGSSVKDWSVDDVVQLFRKCKFDHIIPVVQDNSIDGKTLLALSDGDLMDNVEDGGLGMKKLQVKRLRQELESIGVSE